MMIFLSSISIDIITNKFHKKNNNLILHFFLCCLVTKKILFFFSLILLIFFTLYYRSRSLYSNKKKQQIRQSFNFYCFYIELLECKHCAAETFDYHQHNIPYQ